MDFAATLKHEVFRPIATILIPGSIGATPWVFLAAKKWETLATWMETQSATVFAVAVLIAIFSGLILENIGSRIEVLIDQRISATDRTHHALWRRYLALETRDEVVGQRYLRTILLRVKFELSMIPAITSSCIGVLALNIKLHFLTEADLILVVTLAFALVVFFIYECSAGSRILADARLAVLVAKNAVSRERAEAFFAETDSSKESNPPEVARPRGFQIALGVIGPLVLLLCMQSVDLLKNEGHVFLTSLSAGYSFGFMTALSGWIVYQFLIGRGHLFVEKNPFLRWFSILAISVIFLFGAIGIAVDIAGSMNVGFNTAFAVGATLMTWGTAPLVEWLSKAPR